MYSGKNGTIATHTTNFEIFIDFPTQLYNFCEATDW